jgi:hypothetical protein
MVSLPPSDKNGLYVWLQYSNQGARSLCPSLIKTFSGMTHITFTFLFGLTANICYKNCCGGIFLFTSENRDNLLLPELKILVVGFTSPPPNHCHGLDLSPIKSF